MKWYIIFSGLVLVLLFVFSPLAFTEEQADITIPELTMLLNEREFFKTELSIFKKNYEALDLKYQNLEQKYQTLELESEKLKIESSLRTDSLQILKKETAFNFWRGFLSGFGFGFAGGNYTGIKIGITL
jgi:hypothetical protein